MGCLRPGKAGDGFRNGRQAPLHHGDVSVRTSAQERHPLSPGKTEGSDGEGLKQLQEKPAKTQACVHGTSLLNQKCVRGEAGIL